MIARFKGKPEQQFYIRAEQMYKKALSTVDSNKG